MSVEAVEKLISNTTSTYVLALNGRDGVKEQIFGSDLDLTYILNDKIKETKEGQNGFLWLFAKPEDNTYTFDFEVSFNEDKLKKMFEELSILQEENITMPSNASISDYEDGQYHIVEAEYGNLIDSDKMYELVLDNIYHLDDTLDIETNKLYVNPEITSEDKELVQLKNELNKYLESEITYEFGEVTEMIDRDRIHEWLIVSDDLEVSLDESKIKEFVDHIGKTYNTFGKTRTLKTSYGETIEIKGGDYGWWLNRGQEARDLLELLQQGTKTVRKPVYYQEAAQYGEDDIGDTYVEINLTAQHLFFYKDGELITESDFVSGNISRNYGTPTGTYPLVYKERNATLVGETYETPVDYWMPFNGNVGMHDAKWRNTFGGEIYKKNGSHGCVNLPFKVAQKIYENITPGTAVYCYELDGTDTKEITDITKVVKEKNQFY